MAKLGLRRFSRSLSCIRCDSPSWWSRIQLISAGSQRCISSASSCFDIG
jgi:hypothetical protein